MCEEDQSHMCIETHSQLCIGNQYGYCSEDNLIEMTGIFNYRDFKGRRYKPEPCTYAICKLHYEWALQLNKGVFPKDVYGYDESDALDQTICYPFTNWDYENKVSNIYTFYYNKDTKKNVLVNGSLPQENIIFTEEWVKKGSFHFDEYNIVELEPISWEICNFYEQKSDACELKFVRFINMDVVNDTVPDKENLIDSSFGISISSSFGISISTSSSVKHKTISILENSILGVWLKERSTFENCVYFIRDHMNDNNGFQLSSLIDEDKNEKSYLFKYSNMLEKVLLNSKTTSTLDFLIMLEQGHITLEVLWVVYVTYNHRTLSPQIMDDFDDKCDTSKLLKNNDMLISLFIKFCSKDELKYFLSVAIEGRRNEITYKRCDFYDYVRTNLHVVKRLVPEHIFKWENILPLVSIEPIDEIVSNDALVPIDKVEVIKMTPLEFWHSTVNKTWSFDGIEESHYHYDKDESIREYLEFLNH